MLGDTRSVESLLDPHMYRACVYGVYHLPGSTVLTYMIRLVYDIDSGTRAIGHAIYVLGGYHTHHAPLLTRNPASPRAQNSNPKGKIGITYKADLVSRISNPCRDRREPVQVFPSSHK